MLSAGLKAGYPENGELPLLVKHKVCLHSDKRAD